jgi:hypothetical protein
MLYYFLKGCYIYMGWGRISVNHPVGIRSSYSGLPLVHQEQLPAVVLRTLPDSVDPSRVGQKKVCVADARDQHCLKPLDRDLREPLAANVIDLDYVRTLFLFPLDYLRGTLIAAYQWAQNLLSAEEDRMPVNVDLYV